MLAKNPGFTAVAVLTLALGIGANTAIFSLFDSVMLRLLPLQKPEELVLLTLRDPLQGREGSGFTNPLWEQLRDRQDVFSAVSAAGWGQHDSFDLARGGAVQRAAGLYASGNYFAVLGVRAAAGRLFNVDDDRPGCPNVAVLSFGFWQDHFGGEPGAVGKTISLSRHPFQIIGVSAPGFYGIQVGYRFDVAVPICAAPVISGYRLLDQRSASWLRVIGRVKPGMSRQQLNARLAVLSPQVTASALPDGLSPRRQQVYLRQILGSVPAGTGLPDLRRQLEKPLRILMAVVGLVLLIACANIASLMLARAASRRKEIAVRRALGASRMRVIRQLLTECILLSSAGALVGLLFAHWGAPLLVRYLSTAQHQVFLDLSIDSRVLGFTAAIAVLTGILFGVLPAFRSTRVSLTAAMKGSDAAESERHDRFHSGRWTVSLQVALSLVLLVAAGLFLRSFEKLLTLDIGFDRNNMLLVNVNLRGATLPGVYLPSVQNPERAMTFVIRTLTPPLGLEKSLKRTLWAVDKDQSIDDVRTLEQIRSYEFAGPHAMVAMILAFAVLALILASTGVYSVISYIVAQRTHEIGIHISLGASPRDIVQLVMKDVMALVASGAVIGLGGAFVFGRLLGYELRDFRPYDPLTFSCVSVLLMSAALVACYLPARRAMKVEPMVALRWE
jgi:predicted permease